MQDLFEFLRSKNEFRRTLKNNGKDLMTNNSRPRNVACNLRAKAIMTDFVLCRNLFGYFFSYEKVMTEETANKQQ